MTDSPSRLDTMRADAIAHAAGRIVLALRVQGVSEVRALEFCENEVTLRVGAGLAVYADAMGIQSRGPSDEALTWFARELHLARPDLGGTPVPFGFSTPPEFGGVVEEAARSDTQHAAWDATRTREAETSAGIVHAAQADEAAARVAEHRTRILDAF